VCRRIFFIDGIELTEDEALEEAPVFSLHAVVGVPVSSTIQLRVQVGAASFVALVDTGSTHCFIGEEAAQRAGLPIEPRPRLTATVANGESVACPGVLRQATVVIDNRQFAVDLYIMPLAGYDVVLGTH
jgi:predicted aspartyl protease